MVETLPNCCGLVAARRAHELHGRNLPCRILSLILGPDHPGAGVRHFVLIFRAPDGSFFGYDGDDGSRPLGRAYPHAQDIAEAFSPGSRDSKWITEMDDEHVKSQRQLDRRLFPREEEDTRADAPRMPKEQREWQSLDQQGTGWQPNCRA
jgi:hypothetical protein